MAIAFDNSGGSGNWTSGASSVSYTHTTAGSNLVLFMGAANYSGIARTVSGITYNSVAATKANGITAALEGNNQDAELWYLDSPATGSNTVAVTLTGTADFQTALSLSYTGKTVSGLDANATSQNTGTSTSSPACNVTVVHSDCWLVGLGYSRFGGTPTAGTATTSRRDTGVGHIMGDSNGVVSTGAQTLAFTVGSASTWPGVCSASFSEANAGGGGGSPVGPLIGGKLLRGGLLLGGRLLRG